MTQRNSALSLSSLSTHKGTCHFAMPLSESDIIVLHDMFLTQGLHSITVKNPEIGRMLIYTLLESLPCYSAIAALSLVDLTLKSPIHDLCANTRYPAMDADDEALFLEARDYYDFIWIEVTPALLATSWYARFEKNLIEMYKNQNTPIIKVLYQP